MDKDKENLYCEDHSRKNELESAFSLCMESLDELMAARKLLEDKLREGFMDVARARYAMGITRVTALQYDMKNMKTTTFVVAENRGGNTLTSNSTSEGDPTTWQLRRRMSEDPVSAGPLDSTSSSSNLEASGSGLRRRTTKQGKENSSVQTGRGVDLKLADVTNDSCKENQERMQSLDSSPLRWFGGMVSPHLTSAQARFSSAMDEVLRVVRAQARAQAAQQQYYKLLGKECGFLECDEDSDDGSASITEEDVSRSTVSG